MGEFNKLAPSRDHSSDGSIGDQAHASSSSDHNPDETGSTPYEDADHLNEVHAIDVDVTLRLAGWSMGKCVQIIVMRHRRGEDDRLQNVIYNGYIYSRSWGWTARVYTGSNPHDKHAHFSSRYTTAQEQNTKPWGLLEAQEQEEDDGMANMTQSEFNTRMDGWAATAKGQKAIGDAVVAALETELTLDGGSETAPKPESVLYKAFRRIPFRYPFADGTTFFNVASDLKAFLAPKTPPTEKSAKATTKKTQ